jgi:hypothetical protein
VRPLSVRTHQEGVYYTMFGTACQEEYALMATPWDEFMEALESRKKQLDDVLDAYKTFREKLDALPPQVAQEAKKKLIEVPSLTQAREPASEEFAGKTAIDCAKIILTEKNNQPAHFSVIARAAMDRGYKGRSEGTREEVENRTINSFWAALHRSEEFESAGRGTYRLRTQEHESATGHLVSQDSGEHRSVTQHIVELLQEVQKPMRAVEITHWLGVRGVRTDAQRGLLAMVCSALRKRPDLFERMSRGVYQLVNR